MTEAVWAAAVSALGASLTAGAASVGAIMCNRVSRPGFLPRAGRRAIASVNSSGINPDTLRGWVLQVEIDEGRRPGVSSTEATRIAELERENKKLHRSNAIVKSASAFFAAELDRPRRLCGVERSRSFRRVRI